MYYSVHTLLLFVEVCLASVTSLLGLIKCIARGHVQIHPSMLANSICNVMHEIT